MPQDMEEVAAAHAKRREEIRAWAAQQVDPTLAVTFVDDEPDYEVVTAPEADNEPGPAVAPAEHQEKPEPGEPAPAVGGPEPEPVVDEEEGVEEPVAEVEPEAEEAEEAPANSANKGEWVAYRMVTHKLTEDEANEKTKQELIDLA